MKFNLDRASLSEVRLDELSRQELVKFSEDLMQELEKTRSELSESVRSEVNLKFELDRVAKMYRDSREDASG